MPHLKTLLMCSMFGALTAGAASMPDGLRLRNDGGLWLGDIPIQVLHFDKNWKMTSQICEWTRTVSADEGYPTDDGVTWLLKGRFAAAEGFSFEQKLVRRDGGAVAYSVRLTSVAGVQTKALALGMTLSAKEYAGRTLDFDGRRVGLPAKAGGMGLFDERGIRRITIPTERGKLILEGAFHAYVQDDRAFKQDVFSIRLAMQPGSGLVKESGLAATIRIVPYAATQFDISRQANMGFRDETDGDRRGGWTDQGANDLRAMRTGTQRLGGLLVDVIDPAKNRGASCLVFSGPQRDYFRRTVRIRGEGKRGEFLYLLHAVAWTPSQAAAVGNIAVSYEDGTSKDVEVMFGRDVGDWWNPFALPNGPLVWTGRNAQARIGLYLSKFKIAPKSIRSLSVTGTGAAVWMVVGVLAGEDVPFPVDQESVIVEGPNWRPIDAKPEIVKGGILDFSFLLDAPAGKHGRVVIRDGHFEFDGTPGERARFYGANLCHGANFPSKHEAEALADQLSRIGYNSIRLHHYDGPLVAAGSPDSTDLDPQKLDRLEYLFHCLKRRGIYISIDLYTLRTIRKGGIPGIEHDVGQGFKTLVTVHDGAMRNWQKFARNLLTHRNPYTGLTWAEDPALFSIAVLNENYVFGLYDRGLERAFERWASKSKRRLDDDGGRAAAVNEFLSELNVNRFTSCRKYLRDLGVTAHLTDANAECQIGMSLLRDELDYVDNHNYWDHPKYVEGFGQITRNTSAIDDDVSYLTKMAPTRIFGKPFMVTEYNHVYPNHFRAESGPLMGAYAALQDWDGVYRFDYTDRVGKALRQEAIGAFSVAPDPINLMSDRIAALIVLRGDVEPAAPAVPFAFSKRSARLGSAPFPAEYAELALCARVGGVNLDGPGGLPDEFRCAVGVEQVPAAVLGGRPLLTPGHTSLVDRLVTDGMLPRDSHESRSRVWQANSGHVRLGGADTRFSVVSDRIECFVLNGKRTAKGERVTVANDEGFAVVCVSSVDGRPLRSSRRIMVMHLTDVQESFTTYRDSSHKVLSGAGRLPHLVRRGAADIAVRTSVPLRVWATDAAGKRIASVDATRAGGLVKFRAATFRPEGACLVYELTE